MSRLEVGRVNSTLLTLKTASKVLEVYVIELLK
jgi:hypothetical protein